MTPYKDKEDKDAYTKGYSAGYRKATIDHLGSVCTVCGATNRLEIHHLTALSRKARTLKDLEHLNMLELRCLKHHIKEEDWR